MFGIGGHRVNAPLASRVPHRSGIGCWVAWHGAFAPSLYWANWTLWQVTVWNTIVKIGNCPADWRIVPGRPMPCRYRRARSPLRSLQSDGELVECIGSPCAPVAQTGARGRKAHYRRTGPHRPISGRTLAHGGAQHSTRYPAGQPRMRPQGIMGPVRGHPGYLRMPRARLPWGNSGRVVG